MDDPIRIGDQIGRVAFGRAAPGQTVVGDSTSVMLYKWIRAAMASEPGRDEIIVDSATSRPTVLLSRGIAAELGMRLRWLQAEPERRRHPRAGGEAPGCVRAVVLSDVAYRSGYLADVAAITALAHEHGALVLWDLCHSAGVIPLRLDDWRVDLAVGCTYKYLNGGPGSPAFGYVRADSMSVSAAPGLDWVRRVRSRWRSATPRPMASVVSSAALGRSIGDACHPRHAGAHRTGRMEAIRAKSIALTEFAIQISINGSRRLARCPYRACRISAQREVTSR